MKLELIGKRYSITLMGMLDSKILTGGSDYYAHDEKVFWWKGSGIIQELDGGNPRMFCFVTEKAEGSLERSILREGLKNAGFFHSFSLVESPQLTDREGLVDLLAKKILLVIDLRDEVTMPIPTRDELRDAGVIMDERGNLTLPLFA